MPKPISSFFAPKDKKRKAEDAVDGDRASKRLDPDEEQKLIDAAKKAGIPVKASVGPSWRRALQAEFDKDYFKKLTKFLKEEQASGKVIYPKPEDVFSWTRSCTIHDVKVVILGQDPYHGPNQAHGLCFSVQKGVATPSSLVNIYKELGTDVPGFTKPGHGYLQSWADQGVLLLNAVLTVRHKEPNSHKSQGWEKFTDAVIDWLNRSKSGLVFILWGSYAQKKGKKIDKSKHLVLNGVHPSGLSAHRGFYGSKPFSQTNAYLKKKNKTPIDWMSVMEA